MFFEHKGSFYILWKIKDEIIFVILKSCLIFIFLDCKILERIDMYFSITEIKTSIFDAYEVSIKLDQSNNLDYFTIFRDSY